MQPEFQNDNKAAEAPVAPRSTTYSVLGVLLTLSLVGNVVTLFMLMSYRSPATPPVLPTTAFPQVSVGGEPLPEVAEPVTASTNEPVRMLIDPIDYSSLYTNLIAQEGVLWLKAPVSLGIRSYIQSTDGDSSTYYQIGTYNEDKIVFTFVPCDGMACSAYAILLLAPDNTARLLTKNSFIDLENEWTPITLEDTVTVDTETELKALSYEKTISITGQPSITNEEMWYGGLQGFFSESSFNPNSSYALEGVTLMSDTPHGPLFRGYTKSDDGTVEYSYAIRLPGGLAVYYTEQSLPFFSDDRVPKITWQGGTVNTDMYRGDRLTGCGGGGPEFVLEKIDASKLQYAGITSTGEKVFTLIDGEHPLISRIFEMTDGLVHDYDQATGEGSTYTITREEFIANQGVVIVEDTYGRQLVLTKSKYGPQVECGKPVIYLYPEATSTISVAVDALVTKSEPEYKDGWTATAHPDGSLVVNGVEYTSLYWDGYGNGEYPKLHEGFVVPTSEAIATMSEHLRIIGFNETEIKDFADFWSDHLPEEPYTRISWIQTSGMERLARLTISPRPDTLIRAFVDYEGLPEPVALKPQKLVPQSREGYVVTEWGGLLRR